MANALLQYAKSSPQYDDVTNAFQQVILATNADAAARSQAKVGLAIALEKQADLTAGTNQSVLIGAALTNCLDVFVGANLRDGEEEALFWKKEAGLQAGASPRSCSNGPGEEGLSAAKGPRSCPGHDARRQHSPLREHRPTRENEVYLSRQSLGRNPVPQEVK